MDPPADAGGTDFRRLFSIVRLLRLAYIDLLHLKYCFHGPLRSFRIFILQHLNYGSRNNLPRQTISVLEPAALAFCAALRSELLPEIIHFFLHLAVDHERYGFREFEVRAAVQSDELLSLEFEFHSHDRSLWSRPCLSISDNAQDL